MRKNRSSKGFTLVELLVAVLILGILIMTALPSYATSVRQSRSSVANGNAKSILSAVQALYVKQGGTDYADSSIDAAAIAREMGGQIPLNPCNGGSDLSDYSFTQSARGVSVVAKPGHMCQPENMRPMHLGA